MNNRGLVSLYMLIILLLISGLCGVIIYKTNNLLDITRDYKDSFKSFYDDEAMLYELFYDEEKLKNIFEKQIHDNPYIDLSYRGFANRDIECKIEFIRNKKEFCGYTYVNGATKNITRFELITKIINDIYTTKDSYINYTTYDNLEIDKFFYTLGSNCGKQYIRGSSDNIMNLSEDGLELSRVVNLNSRNIIKNVGDVILSGSEDISYRGIIYVKGNLIIESNLDILGMIIIEDGDLIISDDATVDIVGGVVMNNSQDYPENLIVNNSKIDNINPNNSEMYKSQIQKIYYGAYLPNYVEIKPVVIKIY